MHTRCVSQPNRRKSLYLPILKRVASILSPLLVRGIGWVVTVAIPAPVLLVLWLNRSIKAHPWAFGTACLSLLIIAFAWADETNESKPEVLNLDPIEHFSRPAIGELHGGFDALQHRESHEGESIGNWPGRPASVTADSDHHPTMTVSAHPTAEAETESGTFTDRSWDGQPTASELPSNVRQTSGYRRPGDTRPAEAPRVVWLTGEIEESPRAGAR